MNTVMNLSAAPHARDKWTTPFIMRMVTLSLLPATIVGILVYGWNAFGIVALSIISAVAAEWVFNKICRKPSTIWDGSAVVTGLLLALSLGPQTPLYCPVIGSIVAIVVCKCCFGGIGTHEKLGQEYRSCFKSLADAVKSRNEFGIDYLE